MIVNLLNVNKSHQKLIAVSLQISSTSSESERDCNYLHSRYLPVQTNQKVKQIFIFNNRIIDAIYFNQLNLEKLAYTQLLYC